MKIIKNKSKKTMDVKAIPLCTAIFLSIITYTIACSCMLTHPQSTYCKSDFVILARVKKVQANPVTRTLVYKLRIRKEFKISEKGIVALKSGKLHSAMDEAACGVNLQQGGLYVISGWISSLRAHTSLCNNNVPWKNLTRRQKKGFKKSYKLGCTCQIAYGPFGMSRDTRNVCHYTKIGCEDQNGICMRQSSGRCDWNKNKELKECRKSSPWLDRYHQTSRNRTNYNIIP